MTVILGMTIEKCANTPSPSDLPVTERNTLRHLRDYHGFNLPLSEMVYLRDQDFDVLHRIFSSHLVRYVENTIPIKQLKYPLHAYLAAALVYELLPLLAQYRKDTLQSSAKAVYPEQQELHSFREKFKQDIIATINQITPYSLAVGHTLSFTDASNRTATCDHHSYHPANLLNNSFFLAKTQNFNTKTREWNTVSFPKYQFGHNNNGSVVEALHLFEDTVRATITGVQADFSSNAEMNMIDCINYGTVEDKVSLWVDAVDMLPQMRSLINEQHKLITSDNPRQKESAEHSNNFFTVENFLRNTQER